MSAFWDRLIRVIDQRIVEHNQGRASGDEPPAVVTASPPRIGTVVSRDPGVQDTGTWPGTHAAAVTLDGDAVAVPVFVMATVRARPGDRVLLIEAGADWFVIGSFGRIGFGASNHFPVWGWDSEALPSDTTNSSATYAVLGNRSVFFGKEHHWTNVMVQATMTAFCDTANSNVRIGVRFTHQATGTVSDFDLTTYPYNQLGIRHTVYGQARTITIPDGPYTMQMLWKRSSGTGAIHHNTADFYSLLAQEVPVPHYTSNT